MSWDDRWFCLVVPAHMLLWGYGLIYTPENLCYLSQTRHSCDNFCLLGTAGHFLTTYLPTDREKLAHRSVPVGRSSQLALFSALSRSFSAATSVFISVIITANNFSHSSSVPA